MRPLFLSLEHFGPFRERQDIDFAALDDFFLVCGRTGSGKTTIFDAITYALFGETVGGRSNLERELPSRFSPEGSRPWVELTFSAGGSVWKVQRVLPYRTRGRNGAERVSAPEATLLQQSPEGVFVAVESKVSTVNERISSLLMLGADEFSRIVLLPQGEFQRFLEMKSSERVEILEKLFDVSAYDRLAESARQWAERVRLSLAGKTESLARLDEELGAEPEQRMAEIRRELLAADAEAEARARRIQALSASMAGLAELQRRWEALRQSEQELQRAEQVHAEKMAGERALVSARTLSELEPLVREAAQRHAEALEQVEKALQHAERIREIEAGRPGHFERQKRISLLRQQQAELNQRLAVLKLAAEAWQRKTSTEAQLAEAEARCAQSADLCTDAESALAATKEHIASLEAELANEPEAQMRFRRLSAELQALDQLQNMIDAWEKLCTRFRALTREDEELAKLEQEARTACAHALETRTRLQTAVRQAQAGYLAASLKEGEPCPVCGSVHHPQPAPLPQDIPDGSALEQAQRHVEETHARLSVVQEKLKALSLQKETLDAERAELEQRIAVWRIEHPSLERVFGGRQIPDSAVCQLQAEACVREIERVQAALDEYARQRSLLASLRARQEREQSALEEARAGYRACSARLEALKASLSEIALQAGDRDPEPEKKALERTLHETAETIQLLEQACREWETARAESEAHCTAQMSVLSKSLPQMIQSAEKCFKKASAIDAPALMRQLDAGPSLTGACSARQELGTLLEKLQQCWPAGMEKADTNNQQTGKARENLARAASQWAHILEDFGLDEPRALEFLEHAAASFWPREKIQQAELELDQTKTALRDAQTRYETLREDFHASLRASDAADLSALSLPEAQMGRALAETLQRLASEKTALEQEYRLLQDSIAQKRALETRIRDLAVQRAAQQKEYEAVDQEFRRADRLARLLNGELVRGRRLPFKNFILQTVFREITARASERLYRMSAGRYLVEPQIQGLSGNQKIGLELAVLDAWNGAKRPVGTLSGGEKFMLAISLALGLADSLHERAGAGRLESLFIDEGFGSLDAESLSMAISVLDALRGDRMVAIVSHVEELANRIPSRIVVEKGAQGSSISIERD